MLVKYLLMRTDKVSMVSSLEVRVPYLMPEVLVFMKSVPENQLVDFHLYILCGVKKFLESLFEDVFGKDFTYRWKKWLGIPTLFF